MSLRIYFIVVNKQFIINMTGAVSGAILVGMGLAGSISGGIALGPVLLLISGSGITAKNASILQSNSTALDDRLVLFTVAMVVISVTTAIWYVSLMG
jgi:hypothetical protein